jgi:hypothetical protein
MTPKKPKKFPPLPEVYGSTEVANELGVRISNLGAIADLPGPDQVVAAGRVWRAERIRDFAAIYKARQLERRENSEERLARRTSRQEAAKAAEAEPVAA